MSSNKTAVNEVEAELKKPENKGVIVSVNDETGETQAFMAPKPYWQTGNDAGGTGSLTASEVTALKREHDELVTKLPTLKKAERSKATTRINVIEGTLRRARGNEEAVRRGVERDAERPAQRYGQPGNATQRAEADPFKRAVENLQKSAPAEFKTAVEQTRAQGGSVVRAIRNTLLK
jgi:hypothetical protein